MPAMNTFSSVRVTVIQTAVLIVLTLATFLILGMVAAYSVLLGGLVSVIPNAYFGRMVFRHTGARAIENVVRSAFVGELVKLLMMGAGFGLIFAWVEPVSAARVFAGFVLTHMAGIAGLIWLNQSRRA